jgi:uncharacterized protein YggT (Ycf19 family)
VRFSLALGRATGYLAVFQEYRDECLLMTLESVDLLFNLIVMLFWVRLWNPDPGVCRCNPYLEGAANVTQPVMDIFRGRTRGRAPFWTALVPWLALIIFRGIALPWAGTDQIRQSWVLGLGFEYLCPAQTLSLSALTWILFSFLSFAIFLFKAWGLCLLLLRGSRGAASSDPVVGFVYSVAKPFSAARPLQRAGVLFGYGLLLTMIPQILQPGGAALGTSASAVGLRLAQALTSVAAGVADLLLPLQTLMMILIVGSWVAMFGGGALMYRCQEWLNFLLIPFQRFPLRIGPLDLTPLLAFAVFGFLHWLLNGPFGALRFIYLFLANAG